MPYLVEHKNNWADEFDVRYATILSNSDYQIFMDALERYPCKNFEYHFGTNEWITFDLEQGAFIVTEITQLDADGLKYYKLHNNWLFDTVIEYLLESFPEDIVSNQDAEDFELFQSLMHIKLG